MSDQDYPPQPPIATGLAGRCPRCGQGKIFNGFIALKPRCQSCGLDFSFADSADGPAVFIMLIGGFIVCGLALWLEVSFEPPWWVHLFTTFPVALIVCLGMLRPLKGVMVALQYHHKAEEGRLER
ncbi:DUF983 domain-containing protein [Chelatococcus asaccharovorans]|uniref:DUF983 domain-containing protein n=1 Tax=Chelatococcus asaccharovorans TaxID=28210 RepID=UPI00224C6936|nr:DUF983 domain-containing protein [Chelatococcus asaccharovorans]CAH1669524.1 conserved hypothetical protein [Chelatococcus asaccharovorans]CAH1679018.1 conserved hypothetical protein [Chelatococcus asaccharovorans]